MEWLGFIVLFVLQSSYNAMITTEDCGKSQTCFRDPAECTSSLNCNMLVTLKNTGQEIEVTITTKKKWAAFGLVKNELDRHQKMSGIKGSICKKVDGVAKLQSLAASRNTRPNFINPVAGISLNTAAVDNGILTCKFTRVLSPKSGISRNFMQSWSGIIFGVWAFGDEVDGSGVPGYHGGNTGFTNKPIKI